MLSTPSATPSFGAAGGGGSLSPLERDSLAELFNNTMRMVAPSLSGYLSGKNITISNALIEVKPPDAVKADFNRQFVQVSMDYSGAVSGRNVILFNYADAGVISSLMMGDDSGTPPSELTDAHQSTIQEFVSQLISSCATQFADRMGRGINTSPPALSIVNNAAGVQLPAGNQIVKITYNLSIENLVSSKFYHLLDFGMASDLAKSTISGGQPTQQMYQQQMSQPQMMTGQVGISPVKFPPLGEGIPSGAAGNISLLLDVPMTLTVELGRTRQLVKDILGLGEGSIIELDKLAGEPVDLLVNGKLIAKGEVVVIDENFGVRVTDIVSPAERMSKMQT
ncbi:MAG TPA: flagellar motor switch protein FliN [Spirochaetota bacterium]|nr:flagellar motor switch protein FliN [Spirochaetota bacterium]HNT12038.1 flagellar motor switch protein FliN [Spirochaetota bacterium]